jgi:hypothetical protein
VAVELVTTAAVPLKLTVLFAGVVLKLTPVMVTVVPVKPFAGVKLVIDRGTVKLVADVAWLSPTMTVIGPVVAPAGTVVTIWVDVELVTAAAVPLKLTVLFAGVVLKFVPVMVTVVPIEPLAGVKLTIVGAEEFSVTPHPARRKRNQANVPIIP